MENDLNPPNVYSWKYVDDMTMAEVVPKGTASTVQEAIAEIECCSYSWMLRSVKN